jgi:hypothetical protein
MSHRVTKGATPTTGGVKKAGPFPWDGNPGWFMEPVRAWKSMRFESQMARAKGERPNASYDAMRVRDRRLAAGSEEAKGTLNMPGTRDGAMPAWMGPKPTR